MTEFDREYLRLLREIINNGVEVQNRTGINTLKIPEFHFCFNINDEFPILQTKQMFYRQAVTEMLWIWQMGSNDVRDLHDRNVHIWDEWEIASDGTWRALQNVPDSNGNIEKKEIVKEFDKKYAHTIGTAYGYIVNKFNLIDNLIDKIKNNPEDRRMVMSLWQDDYLKTAVLPSCVWSSEWDVTDGKLNAWVHQRSCDVPLGLPFNVTQYATLVNMLAKTCGLKPGTLDWSIKDAHIYVNQVEGIKEQIRRMDELGDFDAPTLWLNPDVKNFSDYDNSKELKDVKILNYKHHGKIKFPIAQ